jgi:hypothetical protein
MNDALKWAWLSLCTIPAVGFEGLRKSKDESIAGIKI